MAKRSDPSGRTPSTPRIPAACSPDFLAEEDEFDRRMMWRLGSWGVGAVGAVVIAVMANQSQLAGGTTRSRPPISPRQAQQLQVAAKESQNEARRLASAIDTLNSDRDRLYSRVTVLEQGLDSVTGAIAKQTRGTPPAGRGAVTRSAAAPTSRRSPRPPARRRQAARGSREAYRREGADEKTPVKEAAKDQSSRPPQNAPPPRWIAAAADTSALPHASAGAIQVDDGAARSGRARN